MSATPRQAADSRGDFRVSKSILREMLQDKLEFKLFQRATAGFPAKKPEETPGGSGNGFRPQDHPVGHLAEAHPSPNLLGRSDLPAEILQNLQNQRALTVLRGFLGEVHPGNGKVGRHRFQPPGQEVGPGGDLDSWGSWDGSPSHQPGPWESQARADAGLAGRHGPVGSPAVRTFLCGECANLLVFDNSRCLSCGAAQAFAADLMELVPLGTRGAACANRDLIGCTWLADEPGGLCLSCRLTRTRPADADVDGVRAWARAEREKRRLVYQLLDLVLPVVARGLDPAGLAFDLLSSRD